MFDFKGHCFKKDNILICMRWYLAYPLRRHRSGLPHAGKATALWFGYAQKNKGLKLFYLYVHWFSQK
jgi:hypothetical protein